MKAATSLQFFSLLRWIDGRPLMDTIEPYRRKLFHEALDTYRHDGTPQHNFVLVGRGKKNNKTTDLVLSCFYSLLFRDSPQGSDCFILASDEDQAGDDLSLAKKLVEINPILSDELEIYSKEIRRRDGGGTMRILPARDIAGAHGKTAVYIGFDEIHAYRNYDQFEALTQDPTRYSMTWVASYDSIYNLPGVPLHDFKALGKSGEDERMLFQWYSGDLCTDPDFAELEPDLRANPSMASWPEGRKYLDQQRRRLPRHKFRRLHHNLPGAPNGAYLDQGAVLDAVVAGRTKLPYSAEHRYFGFVDMSGGSNDEATFSIAHKQGDKTVIDLVVSQSGRPPFNPRDAVRKFATIAKEYALNRVTGDAYSGETFRRDFQDEGITYVVSKQSASDLYEHFEPRLNAGEIELPDIGKLQEQLVMLVMKGAKITHPSGENDDWSNAVAGAVWCVTGGRQPLVISQECLAMFERTGPARLAAMGGYGGGLSALAAFGRPLSYAEQVAENNRKWSKG